MQNSVYDKGSVMKTSTGNSATLWGQVSVAQTPAASSPEDEGYAS